MKRIIQTFAATCGILMLSSVPSFGMALFGASDQRAVITINADGSSSVNVEMTQPRALLEQQLRMWDRFESMRENVLSDDEPPEVGEPAEAKPLTDDELAGRVRELMSKLQDIDEDETRVTVETLEDKVRVVTSRTFSTIEDLLRDGEGVWASGGVAFQNARFESDTNGLLQITLTAPPQMQRYARQMRSAMQLTGAKTEFKLVLPGKVVGSGLPQTEGNTTWIGTDGTDSDSIDAAIKLYDQPVVITAESGGLKLDEPLESRTLQIAARGRGNFADGLPITDAGPGFLAEPLSVTATTLHLFPEGEKHYNPDMMYSRHQTGVVVYAKLFAPRGRSLLSVSGMRVLNATDDKGRPVPGESEDAEGSATHYRSRGSHEETSAQIQFNLSLPAIDAEGIEELVAEVVAITAGEWKEMTLTNLQAHTDEIDLGDLVPGAKMVIRKFEVNNQQTSIEIQVTGPEGVRNLDLQAAPADGDDSSFNSHSYDRNVRTVAGKTTRDVAVSAYSFGRRGGRSNVPLTLTVRHPEDLKRERVRVTLNGLDLL